MDIVVILFSLLIIGMAIAFVVAVLKMDAPLWVKLFLLK